MTGMFYPNVSMNRGQAAKVYATLLGLTKMADLSGYTDVDSSAWYYEYMALCVAAGIFQGGGNGTLSPDAPMSRQEMFVTFARALGIAPVANTDVEFTDGGQIAGWAEGYINALAERGIVSGGGDGSVSPLTAIDRASVMAMLDKAVNEYVVDNGATVAASGDLVLVVADNVTVTGDVNTLVVAGGDNAVTVTGTVSNAAIVTPDNTLSVSGSAKVGNVTIPTAAENASVVVSANASVTTVTSEADNVVISGSGTVGSAVVSGNNTAVNTDGTDLTVAEGTTGVTENSKPVTGGTTVETEPQAPVTPPVHVHSYTVTEIKAADCS